MTTAELAWPKSCTVCKRDMWPASRKDVRNRDQHQGRGLCGGCYPSRLRSGEILDHERVYRPREVVLEEWELLRSEGYSRKQAARRMGMTAGALNTALCRARRAAA